MEPIRILSLINKNEIKVGDCGWLLDSSNNSCEFLNNIIKLNANDFIRVPYPHPKPVELTGKDTCFCETDSQAFDILHKDDYYWFIIMRCKLHGQLFLEDSRGTIYQYILRILVEDEYLDSDFNTIWRKYHSMPDDILFYKKMAAKL